MSEQRNRLLQQSIDENHKKMNEAKQSVVIQQCADDNDMASCYENTIVNILLMQHVQNRLQYLEQNMVAIENRNQDQALCLDCDEEISPRRLAAVSDAVRCTACQARWEEDQKARPPLWGDMRDEFFATM